MSFNSKYTGEEVEALLDKVSDGSVGGDTFNMGTEVKSIDELPPHVNLLTNPLFENDFEDWTINPDYVRLSAEDETFQGRRYAICSYNGSSREEYFCSKAYTADASGNYTISAWVSYLVDGPSSFNLVVWLDGKASSMVINMNDGREWTFGTYTFSVEKGQTIQIGVFPQRTGYDLGVCMPKLEYGDTATAFTDSYLESSGGTELKYYHEEEELAEINAPIIDLYGANVIIYSPSDTEEVRIQAGVSDPSKFCVGPKNISLLPSESKEGKALYNDKEIATVDDIPIVSVGERNLLTNSQFDGLDGWSYSSAYTTLSDEKFNGWNVAEISVPVNAALNVFQTIDVIEGNYYKFTCWVKASDVSSISLTANTKLFGNSQYSVSTYNGDWALLTHISKADSDSQSFYISIANTSAAAGTAYISMPIVEEVTEIGDVITLDSLRQTYPSEKLLTMLDYWFTSGSSYITAAQIMDYDAVSETARIRFKYSRTTTTPYFLAIQAAQAGFNSGSYLDLFYAHATFSEVPSGATGPDFCTYFDLIVPCPSGELSKVNIIYYAIAYKTTG